MLERIIERSRYLSVIAIVLVLLAAVALYLAAAMSFFTVVLDAIGEGPWLPKVAKSAAIGFLNIIDLLIISIGLQTIAIGVYRIFLNPDTSVAPGLQVSTVGELKTSVIKMVGIILAILFLESAFELGPGEPIMYFGIAIAVVIAAFAWASRLENPQD